MMTKWLKSRLGALFGAALLLGGGLYLHAQEAYPAPAKTPEEAGEMFYRLLVESKDKGVQIQGGINDIWQSQPILRPTANTPYLSVLSRAQVMSFSRSAFSEPMFAILAREASEPSFSSRVVAKNGEQNIVEVAPRNAPRAREVVVIPEDGGYRVDLFATFGRWNNLSGVELDKAIYSYTGYAAPSLQSDPVFLGNASRSQCQTQLKQIMLGIKQYEQDYDERLPRARAWQGQEGILPYIRNQELFDCPALSEKKNGYAYNQFLSQISEAKLENEALTVNVYETSNLKPDVFGAGTGRAYRHMGGANYAFADGHVKWLSRDKTPGFVSNNGNNYQFTFKP